MYLNLDKTSIYRNKHVSNEYIGVSNAGCELISITGYISINLQNWLDGARDTGDNDLNLGVSTILY